MESYNNRDRWDKPSFYLHFMLALTVIFQLLVSLSMHRPYLGRNISIFSYVSFRLHEYVGLFTTAILLLYWIYAVYYKPVKLKHLFPWHTQGITQIILDLRVMLHFQLPSTYPGGLAGFIHGLGLLLVTSVGLLGTLLFLLMPNTQILPPLIHMIKNLHAQLSYWLWWYATGHGTMAVLHWVHKGRFIK